MRKIFVVSGLLSGLFGVIVGSLGYLLKVTAVTTEEILTIAGLLMVIAVLVIAIILLLATVYKSRFYRNASPAKAPNSAQIAFVVALLPMPRSSSTPTTE